MSDQQQAGKLSVDQVIAYLQEHPDFFKQHPELIADLNFRHETAGAISIVQRQIDMLRDQHNSNRKQLAELASQANHNEALLHRIKALTVASAAASSPEQVLESITKVIVNDFELDCVYLVVKQNSWTGNNDNVISLNEEQLVDLQDGLCDLSVFCGRTPGKVKNLLSDKRANKAASMAMTKFKYQRVDSYLIIGSKDQNHFTNDMRTDFVSYIGQYLQALLSR